MKMRVTHKRVTGTRWIPIIVLLKKKKKRVNKWKPIEILTEKTRRFTTKSSINYSQKRHFHRRTCK